MKHLIFDYLKGYNIDCDYLMDYKEESFPLKIKRPNEVHPHIKTTVKIQRSNDEFKFTIKNFSDYNDYQFYSDLSEGLIELINQNSEKKVEESELNEGWFGWESEDFSINFGVRNEPILFKARFSFKK